MNPKKPKIKLSKRVNCPYCNKEFKFRKIIRDELDLCFECRNHPTTDIVVKLWFNYNGDLLSVNMTNYPLYNDDLEVVSKRLYVLLKNIENYGYFCICVSNLPKKV